MQTKNINAVRLGKLGGLSKSDAKSAASRENGKKAEGQRRYKRGDVHPVTGKLFWSFSNGHERWVTADALRSYKKSKRVDPSKLKKRPAGSRMAEKGSLRHTLIRLELICRTRVRTAVARMKFRLKMNMVEDVRNWIGCDWLELKTHIESQFKPGMDWSKWTCDGWHIDHLRPLSGSKTMEEFITRCHFTNMRPLWAKENMSKGRRE
jgi:hypothetical protein